MAWPAASLPRHPPTAPPASLSPAPGTAATLARCAGFLPPPPPAVHRPNSALASGTRSPAPERSPVCRSVPRAAPPFAAFPPGSASPARSAPESPQNISPPYRTPLPLLRLRQSPAPHYSARSSARKLFHVFDLRRVQVLEISI